jgi:hypothetical protein
VRAAPPVAAVRGDDGLDQRHFKHLMDERRGVGGGRTTPGFEVALSNVDLDAVDTGRGWLAAYLNGRGSGNKC